MTRWGVISGVVVGVLVTAMTAVPATGAVMTGAVEVPAPRVVAVDGGGDSTCGLDEAGLAYCWGANYSGDLGDGTVAMRTIPKRVTGGELPAGTRFTSVSTGAVGSCALTAAGKPYCWGSGFTRTYSGSVPIAVPVGGLAFTSLAAGLGVACGLTAAGAAYCWGTNNYGEIGDGTTTPRVEPVPVATAGLPADTRFTSLSAGEGHTCGLAASDVVYCWGNNDWGQLGDGTTTDKKTPVAVDLAGGSFASVTAGKSHTCALTTAGKPYCWGADNANQVGDNGWTVLRPAAVQVGDLTFTAMAAGAEHSCGLTAGGAVYCWGWNSMGQLGDGTNELRRGVVKVAMGGLAFTSVTSGNLHTCGLTAAGEAHCWGGNWRGPLGNGTTTNPMVPTAVPTDGLVFASLSTGDNFTCGLSTAGAAYCWGGRNERGQLGDGTWETRPNAVPVVVSGLPAGTKFTRIDAGNQHVCAVAVAGTIYCWGWNYRGQLGDQSGVDQPLPVAVVLDGLPAGTGFTEVSAGDSHTCGLTSAGVGYCWGANYLGQLGDGTSTDRSTPVAVDTSGLPAGTRFTGVAAGDHHTCGLAVSRVVYCWGDNGSGRLGDGTTTTRRVPVAVIGSGFARIAAGTQHTCGVTTAGAVYCWGENGYGQLGDGSETDRSTPVAVSTQRVPEGAGFTDVDAAWGHTCAVAAGAGYCWGSGGYWELGQGENWQDWRPTPVVMPDGVRFADATIGYEHSCALSLAGVAYCWGNNDDAQLGMGLPWAMGRVLDFADPVPDPKDTTAPTGGFTLSASTVAVGQQFTATLVGVDDDVDHDDRIGRVLTWGDGTASWFDFTDPQVTKTYAKAGTYSILLTLADRAGNRRTQAGTVIVTELGGVAFKLEKTSVWHGESFKVAISSVPAGTTKIALNWGDGYVSTLKGVAQSVSHRYHHRNKGALMPAGVVKPTAVLTSAAGSTASIAVGTVTIKRDAAKPKSGVTKPKRPERVSSWKTLRGTASDQGSGVRIVRVAAKRTSGSKTYCYTAKKTWIRVTGSNSSQCGVDVTVSGGKWSLALKSLAKGKLTVTAVATDWSDLASVTAKVTQKLTRA